MRRWARRGEPGVGGALAAEVDELEAPLLRVALVQLVDALQRRRLLRVVLAQGLVLAALLGEVGLERGDAGLHLLAAEDERVVLAAQGGEVALQRGELLRQRCVFGLEIGELVGEQGQFGVLCTQLCVLRFGGVEFGLGRCQSPMKYLGETLLSF